MVKGFGIVNKAEIDVFLELSCFFDDPLLSKCKQMQCSFINHTPSYFFLFLGLQLQQLPFNEAKAKRKAEMSAAVYLQADYN